MRFNSLYLLLLLGGVSILASCEEKKEDVVYSICLIVDGTDAISNQSAIPKVQVSDIENLLDSITSHGMGSFYLTYVDDNSLNNAVEDWSWYRREPILTGRKTGESGDEYAERAKKDSANLKRYLEDFDNTKQHFFHRCDSLLQVAYSREVTQKARGSDIYGAVNKAISCVSSDKTATISTILLVSGMQHNVATQEQRALPQGTSLFLIGGLKNELTLKPEQEFIKLQQAIYYLFSEKFLSAKKSSSNREE